MSMINDALGRASHASKSGGAMPPPPPLPPRPVAPPPSPPPAQEESEFPPPPPSAAFEEALPPAPEFGDEPASKSTRVQIILALLLVLAVGLAAGVNYWANKKRSARAEASSAAGKKPILSNAAEALRQTNALLAAAATAAKIPTNPAPQTVVTTAAPIVIAPAPPVKFPPLRLQSIFYRPASPSVIINGKTLFITDEINGVIVADIQPASVTLVLSHQTNVLTLR